MKVLILVSHVDPTRNAHSYRIANAVEQSLKDNGHECRLIDLVREGFDKVGTAEDFKQVKLEQFDYEDNQYEGNLIEKIKIQQDNIKWCTHIIVIGPIWFGRLPASFYAYTERVITSGFAWNKVNNFETGLLKDKKVATIITAGAPEMFFTPEGDGGLDSLLFTVSYAFRYSGMKIIHAVGIFDAKLPEKVEEHNEWIEKLKKVVLKLDLWKTIPFGDFRLPILANMKTETLDTIVDE